MEPQRIAVFDLDGTIFRWQLFHEFVFELKNRQAFSEHTANELDTALLEWQTKRRGWNDYETRVVQAIEQNVAQIAPTLFDKVAETVVHRSGRKVYSYTTHLAQDLKKQGYFLLALSGSYQEIAAPFAEQYGFDDCIGALYERKDDTFTGIKLRHVPGNKHALLAAYVQENPRLTLVGSVAVGDSGGDTSMLEMVARPIAFNPSDDLLDAALSNGWEVVVERKNIAYRLKKGSDGHFLLVQTDRY